MFFGIGLRILQILFLEQTWRLLGAQTTSRNEPGGAEDRQKPTSSTKLTDLDFDTPVGDFDRDKCRTLG